jgi:hypothetical protein
MLRIPSIYGRVDRNLPTGVQYGRNDATRSIDAVHPFPIDVMQKKMACVEAHGGECGVEHFDDELIMRWIGERVDDDKRSRELSLSDDTIHLVAVAQEIIGLRNPFIFLHNVCDWPVVCADEHSIRDLVKDWTVVGRRSVLHAAIVAGE